MREIEKRLAYNIVRLRKKKGLSQIRLAEMVDISAPFMMHIEHGTRGASLETVELLAEALEVDIPVLFLKPRGSAKGDGREQSKIRLEKDLTERISKTVQECIDDYFEPTV